jgi:hypothetical protein
VKRTCFFRSTIDINDFHRFLSTCPKGIAENVMLARYDIGYRNIVREFLRGLFDGQDRRIAAGKSPYVVEVSLKVIGDCRTVDQNAMLWKLYTLIAEILNHDDPRARVKPSDLYDADMVDYAPIHTVTCHGNLVAAYKILAESGQDALRGHLIKDIDQGDGNHVLTFRETTSFWDTVKLADLITAKIADLEDMGRTRHTDGFVKAIIDDFHKMQSEKKKA